MPGAGLAALRERLDEAAASLGDYQKELGSQNGSRPSRERRQYLAEFAATVIAQVSKAERLAAEAKFEVGERLDDEAVSAFRDLRTQYETVLLTAQGGPASAAITNKRLQEFTDLGNSYRLVDACEGDLITTALGDLTWTGTHFARDEEGRAQRMAKATARAIQVEGNSITDKDERSKVIRHGLKSEAAPRIAAMLNLARSDERLVRPVEGLDADPFLLTCLNGTVDLRDGELNEHRRSDLITKLAPVEFDPDAAAPRFRQMLDEVIGDQEVIDYLQRAAGYSATGDTREQVIFILEGEGANGKTTFLEALAHPLGDYASAAASSTFMTRPGRSVRSDLARLRGARLVRAAEVEDDARFAEVLLKQMTGGDKLVASYLYKDEFEFRPSFKVWIAANSLPEIRGNDHAIWRRIRRIAFAQRIKRPDMALPDRLRAEAPGILAWIVEGAVRWHKEGLVPPAKVAEATAHYRSTQDSVGRFVEERCVLEPRGRVPKADLFAAYERFCEGEGVAPKGRNAFGVSVAVLAGVGSGTDGKVRFWTGIGVSS